MTSEQKGVDVLAVMKADFVDASVTRMHDEDAEEAAATSVLAQCLVAELLHLARIACELGRIPEGLSEAVNAARGQP